MLEPLRSQETCEELIDAELRYEECRRDQGKARAEGLKISDPEAYEKIKLAAKEAYDDLLRLRELYKEE